MSRMRFFLAGLCIALGATAARADCADQGVALALELTAQKELGPRVDLCVGQIATLAADTALATVIVGDPGIVATNVVADDQVVFTALREGRTSVLVLGANADLGASVTLEVAPAPQGARVQVPAPVAPAERTTIIIYQGAQPELMDCKTDCVKR